jgi:hypothetical protein
VSKGVCNISVQECYLYPNIVNIVNELRCFFLHILKLQAFSAENAYKLHLQPILLLLLLLLLQVVLGVDMFALLAYNMSGMMVTDHLGAVFR